VPAGAQVPFAPILEAVIAPSEINKLFTAFAVAGIDVEWMDYSGYNEYPQLYPPFEHGVSIIDLVLNAGQKTQFYMKYVS
jgi:hypothetical protein